jgi:hypothetical protein
MKDDFTTFVFAAVFVTLFDENIRPAPNVYDRLGKPKEPVSYIYLR